VAPHLGGVYFHLIDVYFIIKICLLVCIFVKSNELCLSVLARTVL